MTRHPFEVKTRHSGYHPHLADHEFSPDVELDLLMVVDDMRLGSSLSLRNLSCFSKWAELSDDAECTVEKERDGDDEHRHKSVSRYWRWLEVDCSHSA